MNPVQERIVPADRAIVEWWTGSLIFVVAIAGAWIVQATAPVPTPTRDTTPASAPTAPTNRPTPLEYRPILPC